MLCIGVPWHVRAIVNADQRCPSVCYSETALVEQLGMVVSGDSGLNEIIGQLWLPDPIIKMDSDKLWCSLCFPT